MKADVELSIDWEKDVVEIDEKTVRWLSSIFERVESPQDYPFREVNITEHILEKQEGGRYHGWLVVTGVLSSLEKLDDESKVAIEKNIGGGRKRPDAIIRSRSAIVEAGGVSANSLEERGKQIVFAFLQDRDHFSNLLDWKIINVPKDFFPGDNELTEDKIDKEKLGELEVLKPETVNLEISNSELGYYLPGVTGEKYSANFSTLGSYQEVV
ncbi:hypothetical protein KY092_08335 [Natronomonas gomsonensis]|uniref:hypothetical protein n=1 Tax=Natronomonas gomsonensis TaxID=1046043 RepID=UPI0020CA4617|nr:hypothetical protein [Natronomonas gomsonensis]MCY4730565.1 hypothetical protein [Natronomonas gomsonensis]